MIAARHILNSTFGLFLPVVLVAGLLNFPTTCACGATLPHEHSLFVLHDHHHVDVASSSDKPSAPRARASSDRMPSDDHNHSHGHDQDQGHGHRHDHGAPVDGNTGSQVSAETLQVSAPTTSWTFGEQLAVLGVMALRAPASASPSVMIVDLLVPQDHAIVPEPPPPQA